MTLTQRLVSEFARVYGCSAEEDVDVLFDFSQDGAACVQVDGWDVPRTYSIMAAVAVLQTYKDGAASSPAGDETVRDDLEQQGALIGENGVDALIVRYMVRERTLSN